MLVGKAVQPVHSAVAQATDIQKSDVEAQSS